MGDKYYCFKANETTKRGKITETTLLEAQNAKYEHGAIISNDIADSTDLFILKFDNSKLKTTVNYINGLEIDTLDEVTELNDGNILDIVLNIPRTLYISLSSATTLQNESNQNKVTLKIKGTTTKHGDTLTTYTIELTKDGVNYVGGTNEAFTTIHSIQITGLNEISIENFESVTLSISSGDGVGVAYGSNNIYMIAYYYSGVIQNSNGKSVVLDKTNKKLSFSDRANFTNNSGERILVFKVIQ